MKRGRQSYQDKLRANKRALDQLADMAGKPRMDFRDLNGAPLIRDVKPRAKRSASNVPLESDVLRAVMQFLRLHPRVAWVCRMNSGVFQDGDRFIRANTQRGMSDILGMLHGGRLFACECKRPGGTLMPHQQEFLETIRCNGGLAFVATCIEDVQRSLA